MSVTIQGIKQYNYRYVSWKVVFETNRDIYCKILMILTTMFKTNNWV